MAVYKADQLSIPQVEYVLDGIYVDRIGAAKMLSGKYRIHIIGRLFGRGPSLIKLSYFITRLGELLQEVTEDGYWVKERAETARNEEGEN